MTIKKNEHDHVARARAAWRSMGEKVPEYILALASDCNRHSLSIVGHKVGYSGSTLSTILGGNYNGNMAKVEDKLSAIYFAQVIVCPVLGDLKRHKCLENQDRPFRATSAHRARLYHACRDGACIHSKHTKKDED